MISLKRIHHYSIWLLLILIIVIIAGWHVAKNQIQIKYPWYGALFPLDFASPTISWDDKSKSCHSWKVTIGIKDNNHFITRIINNTYWKPDSSTWDSAKKYSNFESLSLKIERNDRGSFPFFNQKAKCLFKFSPDKVGSPILYRTIPLPFFFAEQNIHLTGYSLFNVASYKPPHIALDHFRVCGNCHSSSRDGKTISLDFDAEKRDKGGYFIANIDTVITFDKENYISWSRLGGHSTFGLFSKISWSGRYIVTTMKDRVVSKAFEDMNKFAYSQLFFPVNGILVIYDRYTKKLWELPGANDTLYVQSNAFWTPDDKYIIFARAKALPYPDKKSEYSSMITDENLINDFVTERKSFKYDLYIIPFNEGKGGVPEPIKGASNNGKSNYFPAVSPDGKWLIFCQSSNFMMLRPDSRLYILPLAGGEPRYLECNFPEMNSWHAWSPNSKWLVYVSKCLGMYTNMFLTHIDDQGHASVPILLENSKRSDCAVNYPEFINADPSINFTMNYNYINTIYIQQAIYEGDLNKARSLLEKYLTQGGSTNPLEYNDLGVIYYKLGKKNEAEKYFSLAKQFDSTFFRRF